MGRRVNAWLALPALAAFTAACAKAPPPVDDAAVLTRSDEVAERFQAALKQQLKSALEAGGPQLAVTVCHDAAPVIAAQESERSGAMVSRVAERNRNPGGGLTDELRPYYAELAAAPMADGKPARRLWRSGQGTAARINVLRAIPMQDQPCSTCHGTQVAPALAEHIRTLYPEDTATGFNPGDLRGAMLISWPAELFDQ